MTQEQGEKAPKSNNSMPSTLARLSHYALLATQEHPTQDNWSQTLLIFAK